MGVCASQPRIHHGSTCSPEGSLKSQSSGLQPCISKQTTASASSVSLDANELDDDTLGEILSKLPLQHLVQLSSCSRRLYRLVQQSDKVIKSLDLQQLSPQQLDPALRFLQQHPAACAIHTAVLPSNCCSSATALAALSGLHQLTLFRACKVPFTEPELVSLPLQQLQHLTDLGISLVSGDVPAGQHLPLPSQLQRLQVSATTFSLAINVLPLQQLQHLTSLKLSVMDSGSTKSLPKLLTLTALQHLSLGRFWVVPDVLHNFSSLQSLEVYVYGKVLNAPIDDMQMPLCATACGLNNLPARPNLQLQVHVSVMSKCDGLAYDWANLTNMRSLHLDNIYPCPGGFQLQSLADLGRLACLRLGFEAQHAVAGQWQRLELLELYQLIHLKDLLVTCSGPWMELVLEAPKHLSSLLVACEGRLVLAAPGTAAAAAAAKQAAQLSKQSSSVMRLSLDTPPQPSPASLSPSASGNSSPASGTPPSSPRKAAAPPSQGIGCAAATLLGGFGGWSGPISPASAGSDSSHGSAAAAALKSSCGTATGLSHDLPDLGVDDCSAVLQMQRRLDRLGSIGETEEVYNQEDEAEQLSHISRLGLLTGRGLHMMDPSLSRHSTPSTFYTTCSSGGSFGTAGGAGSVLGRRRSSLMRSLSGAGSSRTSDGPVVVCLDTWLAAKGLKLDNMQLVQQQLSRQSSSSSSPLTGKQQKGRGSSSLFRRRSAPDQLPSGVIGRYSAGRSSRSGSSCGCPSSFGFVVRQNMEEQLLNTFRQSGFAA